MKNVTVKEFIERLQKMNQEAIVCRYVHDDEPTYSTIETVADLKAVKYIDDAGDEVEGDIISIY